MQLSFDPVSRNEVLMWNLATAGERDTREMRYLPSERKDGDGANHQPNEALKQKTEIQEPSTKSTDGVEIRSPPGWLEASNSEEDWMAFYIFAKQCTLDSDPNQDQ